MSVHRGFHHLVGASAVHAQSVRLGLLGALCGLVLAQVWMLWLQQDLQVQQRQQAALQAELGQARSVQAAEQGQRAQDAQVQRARMQAAQQDWRRALAVLEDLAASTGARVRQVRLDGQGLQLQVEMDAAQLQAWGAARPAQAWGVGPAQILEIGPLSQAGSGAASQLVVLRWPQPAGWSAP